MGVSEMAEAMKMPTRTYQHFEAGRGRLNVALLFQFAAATNSDPMALFWAVMLGQPDLAVHCADNKLVSAMMRNVERFNLKVGPAIKTLRANTIERALGAAFDELAAEAAQPDPTADWLAERLGFGLTGSEASENEAKPESDPPPDDETE